MAKSDVLHAFRRISTDATAAASVASGDMSVLGEVDFSADEREMVVGAAGELCESGDEVVGFEWTDPAGGGNDDLAGSRGSSAPGLTFTRAGEVWSERRYVKQLTTYVGLGKPGI